MDIDPYEDESMHVQQPSKGISRKAIAPVDDAHPFDLEAYISGYSGSYSMSRWY